MRMRRVLGAAVAAIMLATVTLAASAAAMLRSSTTITVTPTAFNGESSYLVKPSKIVVDSADGGSLELHWTAFSATRASGSGTAHPDHGSYPIKVELSDPQFGTFQRLTTTFYRDGKVDGTDHLELAQTSAKHPLVVWVQPSALKGASDLLANEPAGVGGTCPGDVLDTVAGSHLITVAAACTLARADVAAGGIGCGSRNGSPARSGIITTSSYLGRRVTYTPGDGILFMQNATYFTFFQQCM